MSSQAGQKLTEYITGLINDKGAISVSEYMEVALGHPEWGYYMRQDPFGKQGDFTTAPEISQMFGEMVGLWLADVWMQFGSPQEFILLECGPGRGTLVSDVLRATRGIPDFQNSMHLHLLETSPVLMAEQDRLLSELEPQWHESLDTIPANIPLFVIANEFFDALPISQYEFTDQGWCERMITLANGDFTWKLKPIDFDPSGEINLPKPGIGKILERSPARDAFMHELAHRIYKQQGAALVFDYGHLHGGYGDTFQAVRGHEFIDTLQYVGDTDLTSHVNFDTLETVALGSGVKILGKATQGEFLEKLGIQVYASKLLSAADEKQADDIQKALHRLTHPDEMGSLFKVIGIGYGPDVKPAGF